MHNFWCYHNGKIERCRWNVAQSSPKRQQTCCICQHEENISEQIQINLQANSRCNFTSAFDISWLNFRKLNKWHLSNILCDVHRDDLSKLYLAARWFGISGMVMTSNEEFRLNSISASLTRAAGLDNFRELIGRKTRTQTSQSFCGAEIFEEN